jgi:MFS superfamily sulfate permease-like transporter
MHSGKPANFDKELSAQGVGNLICGMIGALPMTGVIVRSSANVQAGARTRMAAVLHGLWLLLFVALLPAVLRLVPTAALAAVLVVVGLRLVSLRHARGYWRDGLAAFLPYVVTVGVILARNLLVGVVAGTAAALLLRALAARRRRAA